MIIFMCVVLVLLTAYLRRTPTQKEGQEPLRKKPTQSSRLQQEETKRLHTGFKTQAELLSKQQLEISRPSLETPAPASDAKNSPLDATSSPPQFEPQQLEANPPPAVAVMPLPQPSSDRTSSPPVATVTLPQPWQQGDVIKRQQEDLRRQQETLKQQLKRP